VGNLNPTTSSSTSLWPFGLYKNLEFTINNQACQATTSYPFHPTTTKIPEHQQSSTISAVNSKNQSSRKRSKAPPRHNSRKILNKRDGP